MHYNNDYIVGPGATGCVFDLNKAQSQLQDQINNGLCGCNRPGKGTIKLVDMAYSYYFQNIYIYTKYSNYEHCLSWMLMGWSERIIAPATSHTAQNNWAT